MRFLDFLNESFYVVLIKKEWHHLLNNIYKIRAKDNSQALNICVRYIAEDVLKAYENNELNSGTEIFRLASNSLNQNDSKLRRFIKDNIIDEIELL